MMNQLLQQILARVSQKINSKILVNTGHREIIMNMAKTFTESEIQVT